MFPALRIRKDGQTVGNNHDPQQMTIASVIHQLHAQPRSHANTVQDFLATRSTHGIRGKDGRGWQFGRRPLRADVGSGLRTEAVE